MLRLISDSLISAMARLILPKKPSGHEGVKLRPANQIYAIPGYASAAHSEAVARFKHKKVRGYQKAKTLALHRALSGLKAAKESIPVQHPLLDDWNRIEADWAGMTGCRED